MPIGIFEIDSNHKFDKKKLQMNVKMFAKNEKNKQTKLFVIFFFIIQYLHSLVFFLVLHLSDKQQKKAGNLKHSQTGVQRIKSFLFLFLAI